MYNYRIKVALVKEWPINGLGEPTSIPLQVATTGKVVLCVPINELQCLTKLQLQAARRKALELARHVVRLHNQTYEKRAWEQRRARHTKALLRKEKEA